MFELTPREYEILKSFSEGLTEKEISEKLFITVVTVRSHKNHLLSKLGGIKLWQAIVLFHKNKVKVSIHLNAKMSFSRDEVIKLLKSGMSKKAIANKLRTTINLINLVLESEKCYLPYLRRIA